MKNFWRSKARGLFFCGCLLLMLAACVPSEDAGPIEYSPPAAARRADPIQVPPEPDDGSGSAKMGYLLSLPPEYDDHPEATYPLLIMLHGRGMEELPFDEYIELAQIPPVITNRGSDYPFIVWMPQSQLNTWWGDELDLLNAQLDELIESYAIDPTRIYLTGFSMGASGMWAWADNSPERFAALVAIAGRWPYEMDMAGITRFCALRDFPIWLFHSASDPLATVNGFTLSRIVLEACEATALQLSLYTDLDHQQTYNEAYSETELYDWLLAQSGPHTLANIDVQTLTRSSRNPPDVIEFAVDETMSPYKLGYLVYQPDNFDTSGETAYPLLILLHGSGNIGTDISSFAEQNFVPNILFGSDPQFEFLMMSPQLLSSGVSWGDMADQLERSLDEVIVNYPVDPDRIYLSGYSIGGGGVWQWATVSPERFAAILPVAGFWPYEQNPTNNPEVCEMKELPAWILHGEDDTIAPASHSIYAARALSDCGAENLTLTMYPGIDHSMILQFVYEDQEVYDWLLKQSR